MATVEGGGGGISRPLDTPKWIGDQIGWSRYGGMAGIVAVPGTDVFYDRTTGEIQDNAGSIGGKPITGAPKATATTTASSGGGGGGGRGGGGSVSVGNVNSVKDFYALWYGDAWVNTHMSVINTAAGNRWTERQMLKDIANRGAGNTPYAQSVVNYVRSVCGPLPLTTVMNIIGGGEWTDSSYFEQFIAPQYQTDVLSNPQSLSFVQQWNEYTGGANLGPTAQNKLKEITTRFGYTDAAMSQWEAWLRTTHSANSGNYGAEKRAAIDSYVQAWLGREATDADYEAYWAMVDGPMGSVNTYAMQEAIRKTAEYQTRFAAKLPGQSETEYLAWEAGINSVGNWYFNDRPGVAGEPYSNNFTGFTAEELLQLNKDGWNGTTLTNYYRAVEEAAYNRGVYEPILSEAYGSSFSDDEWFAIGNGGKGSGALRAKLVEAQNRVQFREAYRQVFGSDPSPSDYDRITNEFVSPSELIREYQAIESADEMYEEVNDLLTRVYGDGVTKGELKDMVLGRQNAGELKALINRATALDQYRWTHKQYYGSDPTPADYAKYAGYSGPAELQWEIVTTEKVSEMRDVVNEALTKSGMDPFSDDELTTLYGEQEGYGALRAQVTEATKKAKEIEDSEDWMYNGAEQADQAYRLSEQGGFRLSGVGLAEL